MEDSELSEINLFAKRIAIALKKAIPCKRIGAAVIGLEVPHAHIHLVPIQNESDLLFSNPKLSLDSEEMEKIAADIRRQFV
jgi:histidine triad (HIT) family protein